MKFSLQLHKKKKHIKKQSNLEIDSRHYWVLLLSVFVLAIAAELIYFSVVFIKTTNTLDAPPVPTLETNAQQIRSINKNLDLVDAALEKRIGEKKEEVAPEVTETL